ncbi:hypothetical protein KDL44_08470 [bacterium]|nr:hypothetical protein [bacterium]
MLPHNDWNALLDWQREMRGGIIQRMGAEAQGTERVAEAQPQLRSLALLNWQCGP